MAGSDSFGTAVQTGKHEWMIQGFICGHNMLANVVAVRAGQWLLNEKMPQH